MTLLWFISAAILVALVKWSRTRRTANRLDQISPAPARPTEAFVLLTALAPHRTSVCGLGTALER